MQTKEEIPAIPGIKLIYQTGGQNIADDPSYPFKLKINLRPPEFMVIAWIGLYGGSEEVIVRGMTREVIDKFIEVNEVKTTRACAA